MCDQGFDQNPYKIAYLTHIEFENLLSSLKVLPGQREKFKSMQDNLRSVIFIQISLEFMDSEARIKSAIVETSTEEIDIKLRTGSMDHMYRHSKKPDSSETLKLKIELSDKQKQIKVLESRLAKGKTGNIHLPPLSDSPKIYKKVTKFAECEEKRELDSNELGKSYDS